MKTCVQSVCKKELRHGEFSILASFSSYLDNRADARFVQGDHTLLILGADQKDHRLGERNWFLNTEPFCITEAELFSLSVTNPSFNVLFEMSQSLHTGVCFMAILCK